MELEVLSSVTREERMLGQSPCEWAGFLQEEGMAEGASGEGAARAKPQRLEREVSGKNSEKLSLDTTQSVK